YTRRREQILAEASTRRARLISDVRAFARERGFVLEMTPTGISQIPLQNGQPMPPELFEMLPPETREEIDQRGKEIQTGYLQSQYAQSWPLLLGATLTFEQSYGGIDGDSASTTELYAL